jgi:hypothetical protein
LTHSKYKSGKIQLTKNHQLFLTITFLIILHKRQIYLFCCNTRANKYNNIMNNFNDHSQICVLLVSLRKSGVGLNLVAASHVYIIEPL